MITNLWKWLFIHLSLASFLVSECSIKSTFNEILFKYAWTFDLQIFKRLYFYDYCKEVYKSPYHFLEDLINSAKYIQTNLFIYREVEPETLLFCGFSKELLKLNSRFKQPRVIFFLKSLSFHWFSDSKFHLFFILINCFIEAIKNRKTVLFNCLLKSIDFKST